MDCISARSKFIFYLEGSLGEKDSEEISSHLKSCTDCSLIYTEFARTMDLIEEDKNLADNLFLQAKIIAHLESETVVNDSRFLSVFPSMKLKPVLITLAFLLTMAVGVLIGQKLSVGLSYATDRELAMKNYANELYINEINDTNWEMFLFTK